MPLEAVQHIRRMRGGAQAHLMRCSDGHFYIVKFCNNPQHIRVLANEMFATRLADWLGLPVPLTNAVEVGDWLIEHTPDLHIQLAHSVVRCQPGLQFGSKYIIDPGKGQVFDYIPEDSLNRVKNLKAFAGMLAFDKWTGNADGRQVAFGKWNWERKYTATFIDQGYCFNADQWNFPDYPLRGVYARNEVYETISGWDSFAPWISRIEKMPEPEFWEIAESVPPEWYNCEINDFEELVRALILRRFEVRKLIEDFRLSPRRPFPRWACAA